MKTATELAKRPAEFLRTTGVNYATFTIILEKAAAHVKQFKEQNPIHRRGRKGSLSLSQQLLLTLMYMRQYHTFLSLGQAFSVSESYAHKRYCHMRGILVQVLEMPAGLLAPTGPLKVAVDVSEQPVERPLKGQWDYYSGKKNGTRLRP
ncbi:transposase family protein [Pontibacter sp. E15-1]|uniref:transposase family protein n=1 Tax=Pontibacter sp. E15-1 TaxID=2919918 RepID=UPI001F4F2F14|nr:transposase family protein [Pontibacter sp. E15-1]MCJ8165151.1 transposase family protein [Pontibacter sp. E15-1]